MVACLVTVLFNRGCFDVSQCKRHVQGLGFCIFPENEFCNKNTLKSVISFHPLVLILISLEFIRRSFRGGTSLWCGFPKSGNASGAFKVREAGRHVLYYLGVSFGFEFLMLSTFLLTCRLCVFGSILQNDVNIPFFICA